jgi:hypothetical protein
MHSDKNALLANLMADGTPAARGLRAGKDPTDASLIVARWPPQCSGFAVC